MANNNAKMERRIAGLISTFQCISSLAEKTKNATPQNTSKMLAETRLSLLETNWERFQTEHIALLDMNCENLSEAPYFKDAVESRCQQSYEEAKVSLLTVKEHYEQVEPTGAHLADVSAFPGTSNIRSALPKLRVPDFDGEFQSWRPFRDLFVSLVGQNQDITAVEKMHYLRLSVKGDAAKLIANLPLSSDSFISAWDLLVTRYENKRLLVTSHLDRFFSMPTIVPRSYKSLNALISNTSEILNALRSLEMPVDEWSIILAHFLVSRLDPNLREQWELKLGNSTTPATLPQLREFLTTRARALESIDVGRSTSTSNRSTSSVTSNSSRSARTAPSARAMPARGSPPPYLKVQGGEWTADTAAAVAATVPLQPAGSATQCCHYCLGSHFISKCDLFKRKPPKERRVIAEQRRLCFNCLGPHSANNCRITGRCLECNGKHHTLIHLPSSSSTAASTSRPSTSRASSQSQTPKSKPLATSSPSEAQDFFENSSTAQHYTKDSSNALAIRPSVLLATSQAILTSSSGISQRARLLIDPGAELSFISERTVQLLRTQRMAASINIHGIGGQPAGRTRRATTVTVSSIHDSNSNFRVTAFILNALTSTLPSFATSGQWEHLQGLLLADPDFLKPGPIDVIIGADAYGLLVESDVVKGRAIDPIAQRTLLGWIVLGPVNGSTSTSVRIQHVSMEDEVTSLLAKFWEQEEIPPDSAPTTDPDESSCEQHFKDTHTRDQTGRYIVRLPFKNPPSLLGDSYSGAKRCLLQLLRRLSTNESYRGLYNTFLQEHRNLSHMARAPTATSSRPRFFLPHHGVFRAHSATTKLRVVFNGSFKSTNGVSINDILHTGAKLQQDTFDVLLWIRRHRFIFATDVAKMFRQIAVHPDDWNLQQILWVDQEDRVVPYQLTTVTYGLTCAPFLAIRVMLQLVEDEGHDFPLAISPLTNGRYVDDIFGGADTIHELQATAQQLQGICQRGCFPLQKWTANSTEALQNVTSESQSHPVVIQSEDPNIKLLGLVWNPNEDNFRFLLQLFFNRDITKRTVLSETASLFDPLGFISPVIVIAKVFLQELWLAKLHWDDGLPIRLQEKWIRFRESLSDLSLISLPRWLHLSPSTTVELHGFSDASQLAMSAVIYLRTTSVDGATTVTLVCSKTKVAPLKQLTIPRLELTAALLLSRLASHVQRTLDLTQVPVSLWTDSSVALTWITSNPARWKDFVRNRVTSIQNFSPHATWRFIAGKENPADCASRGQTPRQLAKHKLWWYGPEWLARPPSSWPVSSAELPPDGDLEHRSGLAFATTSEKSPHTWDLLQRYSSLTRLLRITAMCQRAVARFKRLPHASITYPLNTGDLEEARFFWIRLIQRTHFSAELRMISSEATLNRGHSLAALNPFVDQFGTLRVGGRLTNALIQPEAKHPPILPRTSPLTSLIIADSHLRTLHGGTQSTLSFLRRSYWIPGGRAPIRSYILRCTTCARFRGLQAQQLMGQLPTARVTPSRAFLHTGIDYAGPFTVKTWRGRGTKTYKAYLAVFVCFTTSAVHLELVTDYTSEAFVAAYRRFSGRRGLSHTIYSDCGTNFIGADTALRALFKAGSAEMDSTIISLTNLGTNWSFNPPAAPHMGGKWEAAVKSAKYHLRRVIGEASLTYEEFTTLLAQVEAVLNSRPLCPLSDDPEDLSPLTPGHFTIGEALTTVPEPSLTSLPETRLSRWQFIQAKLQHFWQRWSSEYLQRSLSISKWRHPSHEIQIGSLVLITDERLPPSRWPLARVVELHPGSDGLTRVVTLRTATSTFKRPTAKLAVLPMDSSSTTVAEGGENVSETPSPTS